MKLNLSLLLFQFHILLNFFHSLPFTLERKSPLNLFDANNFNFNCHFLIHDILSPVLKFSRCLLVPRRSNLEGFKIFLTVKITSPIHIFGDLIVEKGFPSVYSAFQISDFKFSLSAILRVLFTPSPFCYSKKYYRNSKELQKAFQTRIL